jgi:hypothetical protein
MSVKLGFLHTLEANIEVFENLSRKLGFDGEIVHRVEESAIADLQASGFADHAIAKRIRDEIEALIEFPVDLAVCTCSSIGEIAESMNGMHGTEVQRIDRAMSDAAVAAGSRIVSIATLPSTLEATRTLLESSAENAGREIELLEIVVDSAWACYEQGDFQGYFEAIATCAKSHCADQDAIVLAQASMADAASLLKDAPIPVLSSPELGVRKALETLSSV